MHVEPTPMRETGSQCFQTKPTPPAGPLFTVVLADPPQLATPKTASPPSPPQPTSQASACTLGLPAGQPDLLMALPESAPPLQEHLHHVHRDRRRPCCSASSVVVDGSSPACTFTVSFGVHVPFCFGSCSILALWGSFLFFIFCGVWWSF